MLDVTHREINYNQVTMQRLATNKSSHPVECFPHLVESSTTESHPVQFNQWQL